MILPEFHIFSLPGLAETRAITGFSAAKIADFLTGRGFADDRINQSHKSISWQRDPIFITRIH